MIAYLKKRLTRKNLALHAHSILPASIFELLLEMHLFFFPRLCHKKTQFPNYTDGEWITRKPTHDQRAIVEYLLCTIKTPVRILHIGIGNSFLAQQLQNKDVTIDGISIVQDEITHAKEQHLKDYSVWLMNKYGSAVGNLPDSYDYIADNDLAGYACCLTHFHEMMDGYLKRLKKDGVILTGRNGMTYFDCGFGMTKRFKQNLIKRDHLTWTQITPDVIAISKREI